MVHKAIILILPFAAIAVLFLWPFRESFIRDRYAEWYETNTYMETLVGISAASNLAPPPEPAKDIAFSFELDYHGTSGLLVDFESWTVLDAWCRPIWLKPVGSGSSRLMFVSFGPNGRDDDGLGDDYAVEVDTDSYLVTWTWPPVVVWPPLPPSPLARAALATPAWVPFLVLGAYPIFILFRGPTDRRQLVTGPMSILFAMIAISALVLGVASFLTPISWVRESGLYLGPKTDITVDDAVLDFRHSWSILAPPNCVPSKILGTGGRPAPPKWITDQSMSVFGLQWRWRRIPRDPEDCISLHFARLRLPLWIPFVLSTPLAAGPWLCIARRWRKVRRQRRGLCVKCGYDLTGNVSGVCPECGTDIERRASKSLRQL